jgi:hypothetical protein
MKKLKSVKEVVEFLGGIHAVMEITNANYKQAINWPGRANKFPAATYVPLQKVLKKKNATAPDSLWTMRGL